MESPLIFWGDTIWQRDDVKSKFLWYLGLQKSILTLLHYPQKDDNQRPFIPFPIKLFCSPRKGSKIMYHILNMGIIFYVKLSDLQRQTIYHLPFANTKYTKLQWLYFRINHHTQLINFNLKSEWNSVSYVTYLNYMMRQFFMYSESVLMLKNLSSYFLNFVKQREL